MPDFGIDTDALREVAASFGGHATEARSMIDRTRGADVPEGSWGPLGDEFGLHTLYTEVRQQADVSLARIHDFLDWVSQTLLLTVGDYETADADLATRIDRITRAYDERNVS